MPRSLRVSLSALVVVASLAATAQIVRAGGKVKAELLCGTYVDGQITGAVPARAKPKLVDPVACALRVTDAGGQDGALTVIKTVRYAIDPATGKKTKVEGAMVNGSVDQGDDGAYKDTEAVWKPGQADDSGAIAFRSCEDFDVVATVGDAAGTYFTKTLHVAQTCPKPKPIKATVDCFATDNDDQTHKLKEASLGATKSITCRITSKDDRMAHTDQTQTSGQSRFVVSHDDGTTAPGTSPRRVVESCFPTDDGKAYFCDVVLQPGDWSLCTDNRVDVQIADTGGAILFAKTVKWSEVCGE